MKINVDKMAPRQPLVVITLEGENELRALEEIVDREHGSGLTFPAFKIIDGLKRALEHG